MLIWDPDGHTKIGINDKHHMNMDHSAYEGFEIDGKVDTVISRGMVVMDVLGLTDAEPNALVVTAADRERFIGMLRAALTG